MLLSYSGLACLKVNHIPGLVHALLAVPPSKAAKYSSPFFSETITHSGLMNVDDIQKDPKQLVGRSKI